MTQPFTVLSSDGVAEKWGLEAEFDALHESSVAGVPKNWGLAELIRCELRRRGAMTRRELRQRLTPILDVAGFGPKSIERARELADEMADIGESAHVQIDGQRGWASRPSRWLRLGNCLAVVLGVSAIPNSIAGPTQDRQFVRRFDPTDISALRQLAAQGIEEQPLEKWIGTPDWHAWTKSANSARSLDELWRSQVHRLQERGDPFDPGDSKLLCVGPAPGSFFGQPVPGGQGRWVAPSQLPDGIYLGAQVGYSDSHWRPLLVELSNAKGTSLLLDVGSDSVATWELFRWLLIARGLAVGAEEIVDINASEIQLTFPVPKQLTRYLKLVAESENNWRFQASTGFQQQDWHNFYQLAVHRS